MVGEMEAKSKEAEELEYLRKYGFSKGKAGAAEPIEKLKAAEPQTVNDDDIVDAPAVGLPIAANVVEAGTDDAQPEAVDTPAEASEVAEAASDAAAASEVVDEAAADAEANTKEEQPNLLEGIAAAASSMTDKVAEAFSSILPKKDDAEPAADEAVKAPAPDAPAPEEAIAEDAVAEASAPVAAADEAPATTKKPSFLAKVTTILSPRKSKEAEAEVEAEAAPAEPEAAEAEPEA